MTEWHGHVFHTLRISACSFTSAHCSDQILIEIERMILLVYIIALNGILTVLYSFISYRKMQ